MIHVYVNLANAAIRLSLPSGAGYELEPHHAIAGAFFKRCADIGLLKAIEQCPKNYRPAAVHDPLGVGIDLTKSAAKSAPLSQAAGVAASGSSDLRVEATMVDTDPAPGVVGRSAEDWRDYLPTIQDSTLIQTYKLAELQQIAALLGVTDPALTSTKAQTVQAIREAL